MSDKIPPSVRDEARLAALNYYKVLDTAAEQDFDDIVLLAKQLCDVPVALVSLVTAERQWFKAKTGLEACETPIGESVCAYVVEQRSTLIIPDLTQDVRTRDNPLVTGGPQIRFYAGAPLLTPDGFALGALCIIDTQPHPEGLTETQTSALEALARQVISHFESRSQISELRIGWPGELLQLGEDLRAATSVSAAISAAATILGETLNVSRAGYAVVDAHGGSFFVERDWTAPGVASIAGMHSLSLFRQTFERLRYGETLLIPNIPAVSWLADDSDHYAKLGVRALITVPLFSGQDFIGFLFVHSQTPRTWGPREREFVHTVADRTYATVTKLDAEAEQRLLNEELSHRLKNTLAMVRAIATQTLKNITEKEAVDAFNQRIMALSSAHDVLLTQSWISARIKPTIQNVLGQHHNAERFKLVGPDINLGAKGVLSLSMLLHELATNAAKYGSLSVETGHVLLAWDVDASEDTVLTLRWEEVGGPAASEPLRKGFGSRLIAMGLTGAGQVDLRYENSGFKGEFRAPLALMNRN